MTPAVRQRFATGMTHPAGFASHDSINPTAGPSAPAGSTAGTDSSHGIMDPSASQPASIGSCP
ncbi:hypothetical protein ColTof3_02161 [Colletotrichum tofieldiae]|nr:hypothetical protein ColTof3_02161 [Colletotrichum tofieldiae]